MIAVKIPCRVGRMERAIRLNFVTSLKDGEAPLVRAAREGDPTTLQTLLSCSERKIFILATEIRRNPSDAAEIMEEALPGAFEHMHSFEDNSPFYPRLARITGNEALTKLCKRRRNQISLDASLGSEGGSFPLEIKAWEPTLDELRTKNELPEILRRAVAQLHPARRTVFELREVEDQSIQEKANPFGISVPATKSHLLRARMVRQEKLNGLLHKLKPYPSDCFEMRTCCDSTQVYASLRKSERLYRAQN